MSVQLHEQLLPPVNTGTALLMLLPAGAAMAPQPPHSGQPPLVAVITSGRLLIGALPSRWMVRPLCNARLM